MAGNPEKEAGDLVHGNFSLIHLAKKLDDRDRKDDVGQCRDVNRGPDAEIAEKAGFDVRDRTSTPRN